MIPWRRKVVPRVGNVNECGQVYMGVNVPLKLVMARSPSVRDEWKEAPVEAVSKDQRPRKAMSLSLTVCEVKLTLM